MTDKEMLEAAARAAGLTVRLVLVNGDLDIGADRDRWNPLTDDGDALRLAVRLGMDLSLWGTDVFAKVGSRSLAQVFSGNDRGAAIRRAIVRAAAATAEQEQTR